MAPTVPIDTNSDKWKSGGTQDPLSVAINQLILANDEQAFQLDEITEHIIEQYQDFLFLPSDVEGEIDEDTRNQIKTRIAAKLEELCWRQMVDWKIVDDGDRKRQYFTASDKESVSPIAEVQDVFPRRFNKIEDNLNDLSDDIEELDHRVYQVEQENW